MPTLAEEFAAFWAVYPRHVSRLDAEKAYQKARIVATAEEILEGVRQFREHMPDEMRYVPYAASWLNAGRWQDEYETPVVYEPWRCPHTPECHSQTWCRVMKARDRGEVA